MPFSTGVPALDEMIGGGLPAGALTSIYSAPGVVGRRRLLCLIAEANNSIFVDCDHFYRRRPKVSTLEYEDALEGLILAARSRAEVIVLDPVTFVRNEQGLNRFVPNSAALVRKCQASGKTIVLGWSGRAMTTSAKYASHLTLKVHDDNCTVTIEKSRTVNAGAVLPGVIPIPAKKVAPAVVKNRFDLINEEEL